MSQTIEFELIRRRWKLSVRWSEDRSCEFIVDNDRERDARLSDFATKPEILGFQCERYYGNRRAGLWVHQPRRAAR